MKKKSVIITAVVFAAAMAVLVGVFFGMRSRLDGKHIPEGTEISIYGITDMTAGNSGETMEGLSITLPSGVDIDSVMSVSSDPEVAYIEINRDSGDERVYEAKVILKSPGIAHLKVSTTDGKYVSEEVTVNVVGESAETVVTENADGYVYITPSGERYHLKESCAGKTASPIKLEEAVENGYTPCKSCAMHK